FQRGVSRKYVQFGAMVPNFYWINIREEPPLVSLLKNHSVHRRYIFHDDFPQFPSNRKFNAFVNSDIPILGRLWAHEKFSIVFEEVGEGQVKSLLQYNTQARCAGSSKFVYGNHAALLQKVEVLNEAVVSTLLLHHKGIR